ncbi:copper homeostasis protein CutC [Actinoplanes cyaneus]|uniref:PF03932 family protein CutC n=1 Tax=Actinoplanes cyaneus TaxID=52696 RepID=A0A919M3P5_9ACTN|nr:copper homeostasis protein CutC [Actinoplanes cyaneus]MCW2138030.1 copper homeostasis protein [Actinoplanes cyaneus]GID64762.1 copper homeostasis protein CutC [Actinoplanes cyaneus]
MIAFELAVQDAHGLSIATRCGVDRVELCSALALGGVTPSFGLIEAAVSMPSARPAHVLVRPRTGDFDYSAAETAVIVRDVRHAVAEGAAGVVIGGVRDGRIDEALVERVVEAAAGADVTFHRAFDLLPDPEKAIEALHGLGVRRVLTAGGTTTVGDGLPALSRLVTAAAGRVEVMAGGGVRTELIESLVRLGVQAVHASAKHTVPDAAALTLGTAAPSSTGRETTDEREVDRMLAALRTAGARP